MFDIGFSELVLVGVLALLVLGPKRLPEVARTAGRWMAKLRRYVLDAKRDFSQEMQGGELDELRALKRELDDTRRALSDSGRGMMQGLAEADAPRIQPPSDINVPAKKPKSVRKPRVAPTSAVGRSSGSKNGRRAKPSKSR
jgi:sec-independent protein translocase protein TatB